jgi:hypothetical protein
MPTRSKLRKRHIHNVLEYQRNCFHQLIPTGLVIHGTYFSQKVIIQFKAMLQAGGRANGILFILFILFYMDNAKPHNSKFNLEQMTQLGFKRAIHPSYSQDIAPSDFFLFGWLKGEVAR